MTRVLSSSDKMQVFITSVVYFMVVLSPCSTRECSLQLTKNMKGRSVVLGIDDMRLCLIECRAGEESKEMVKTGGSGVHPDNHSKVLTVSCGTEVCSWSSRCLDKGCKKFCEEEPSRCELHSACRGGHVELVKYILSQDTRDINRRERKLNKTPVMVAGGMGHEEVVKVLVENGADLSLTNKRGENILHLACYNGHVEVVEYVLSLHKIDINKREGGKWKRTPLLIAACSGYKEVAEVLVRNGANLSLRDKFGDNILHDICFQGFVGFVKYVLSLHIVDINQKGWRKRTPLLSAGFNGHQEVVELLVQNGADLLLKDFAGNNILHYVCRGGYVEIVKYVLSLDIVDINSRGDIQKTPLLTAGKEGHKEVVKLLLRNGANLSLRDNTGDNILHYICYKGYVDFVKYVLSLHIVDINQKGWRRRTPLLFAGLKGRQEVVELLVQNGADLSLRDNAGNNILHYVCREGHMEIVKYILSLGRLDINAVNYKGETAAKIATYNGRQEVMDLLMSHGI